MYIILLLSHRIEQQQQQQHHHHHLSVLLLVAVHNPVVCTVCISIWPTVFCLELSLYYSVFVSLYKQTAISLTIIVHKLFLLIFTHSLCTVNIHSIVTSMLIEWLFVCCIIPVRVPCTRINWQRLPRGLDLRDLSTREREHAATAGEWAKRQWWQWQWKRRHYRLRIVRHWQRQWLVYGNRSDMAGTTVQFSTRRIRCCVGRGPRVPIRVSIDTGLSVGTVWACASVGWCVMDTTTITHTY